MTTTAPQHLDRPSPQDAAVEVRPQRNRKVIWVAGVVVVAILAFASVLWLTTLGKESTDDAQLQADIVPLAPRVAGAVSRVLVEENQHVKAGELVLQLDDADYTVRVRQAEAERAMAQAALVRARPESAIEARELARYQRLHAEEAVPEQRVDQVTVTARTARAGLLQAEANLAAAEAALQNAQLQLSYAKVMAPGDGFISNISAHPGQILSADQPFAFFVPDRAYVVANFKETQIGSMRPGQRATVTLDAYGHRTLEARVQSLSYGTGAAFSLLPANNATGNFVKVTQRVPVRLALIDPPADLAMRAGLSANVTVYVARAGRPAP